MQLKPIFDFLKELKINNNREWFQQNKNHYLTIKEIYEHFIDLLIQKIKEFDPALGNISSKECIYRIYRDIRFSKDKTPYKTFFDAFIAFGGKKSEYAGYYIHLEPDKSIISGGIYKPKPNILKILRSEIYYNIEDFKNIIFNYKFRKYFNGIYGNKLKLTPKGFPKDFEDIDLLKYKSYVVLHQVNNNFWYKNDLIENTTDIFLALSPFNKFLNNALAQKSDY